MAKQDKKWLETFTSNFNQIKYREIIQKYGHEEIDTYYFYCSGITGLDMLSTRILRFFIIQKLDSMLLTVRSTGLRPCRLEEPCFAPTVSGPRRSRRPRAVHQDTIINRKLTVNIKAFGI